MNAVRADSLVYPADGDGPLRSQEGTAHKHVWRAAPLEHVRGPVDGYRGADWVTRVKLGRAVGRVVADHEEGEGEEGFGDDARLSSPIGGGDGQLLHLLLGELA